MGQLERLEENDSPDPAIAAIGTVLDRKWRLDRLLGVGGMGAVYAATHRNGTRAAIKILKAEAALSPALKRRFSREGYVANKVEHPGAVSILDDDVDEKGCPYLVMELLQGETLDSRIQRAGGRLKEPEVLQIAAAVLECLEAAHARGIVHRDIKPGNLFLTVDGGVKVLDFGIARISESRAKHDDTTGTQALGTPDFMPPEQARGHWQQVDGQSDLFALGAVMLFALTGRKLREAPTTNEQLLAAMVEPLPTLMSVVPDATDVVAALVDRAIAFKKEDRWADAASFRQALRAAYGSISEQPIERAPKLSVRPTPTGPVSLGPVELGASSFEPPPPAPTAVRPKEVTLAAPATRPFPVVRIAFVAAAVVLAFGVFASKGREPGPAARGATAAAERPKTASAPTNVPEPAHAAAPAIAPLQEHESAKALDRPSQETQGAAKPSTSSAALHAGARPPGARPAALQAETAPEPAPASAPLPQGDTHTEAPHVVDLFSRRR